MNKLRILLIVFLLITSYGYSFQEIKIPEKYTQSLNDKKIIYFFSESNLIKVDVESNKVSKPLEFNNNGYNINNFEIVLIKDKFYFIQNIGGIVLELRDKKLIRIDKSYEHKMQLSSSIFTYNNEIYRYGGYGFFKAFDLLLKFDFLTHEWEAIKINNKNIPNSRFDCAYTINDSVFTVIGGTTVDRFNSENKISLNDIWSFSFKEKKWEKIMDFKGMRNINSNSFRFDNTILFINQNLIKTLDINSFKLSSFDVGSTYLKHNSNFNLHFYEGNFYFVISRNNGERVLISRTKKELLGSPKEEKYLSNKKYLSQQNLFILLILISIITGIYFIRRYLNSIYIYHKKIKFRGNTVFINEDEYIVLIQFHNNNYTLENNKLQDILNKDQYDRSHNVRRKNDIINNLNLKFQNLFNANNKYFIKSQKSEYDKRYKKYTLKIENHFLEFKK